MDFNEAVHLLEGLSIQAISEFSNHEDEDLAEVREAIRVIMLQHYRHDRIDIEMGLNELDRERRRKLLEYIGGHDGDLHGRDAQ